LLAKRYKIIILYGVAKYNFGFHVIWFCDLVFQEIRISGDIFPAIDLNSHKIFCDMPLIGQENEIFPKN